MKRTIEVKHVQPRAHVQQLLEELSDRLDEKLAHVPKEAVSLHVVFEENGSHKLYRTSLTCHVPGHMVAAHEERREAGASIREAFAEVERQLQKHQAIVWHERLRKHPARNGRRASRSTATDSGGVEQAVTSEGEE